MAALGNNGVRAKGASTDDRAEVMRVGDLIEQDDDGFFFGGGFIDDVGKENIRGQVAIDPDA